MNSLQITDSKEDQLNEIEDLSMAKIKGALNGNIASDSDEVIIAVKMMGVVAKNRQTLTHRVAVEFNIASMVGNETELKKYVQVTNPQIQKALAGKK